ncbi:hypothetical protein NPIL_64121 [Nephila pilipes]|uniref:Uncharacterized protein n=1 Tax=Nephila pilipes TaxID=299642 RepID=A0A8X6QN73_NEPPI|nr:hypothetical protein NPIL_64121 [Nephila pilipes]
MWQKYDEIKTQTNEKVGRRMIVQLQYFPSREDWKDIGSCCAVYVPNRELLEVLLGADVRVAMLTNCVVKGGIEMADACCDGLNFDFFMK